MANKIQFNQGTAIVWADTTDYAGDGGTRTHQILLAALATGAAQHGASCERRLIQEAGKTLPYLLMMA